MEKEIEKKRKNKIPCEVICNTAMGSISIPVKFGSISEGVRWAKESGYFAYRVFANGKLVRRGFCDNG